MAPPPDPPRTGQEAEDMTTSRKNANSMSACSAAKLAAEKKIAELILELQDKTGAVVSDLQLRRSADFKSCGLKWNGKVYLSLEVP